MKHTILVKVSVTLTILIVTSWIPGVQELSPAEASQSTASSPERLCQGHNVPKNLCFFCDPSLREPGRLWCNEHERYEDRCFICHTELKEENRLWC
jgi:hypothetical protein